MINIVLALIDIIAGIILSASGLPYLPGNGLVVTLAAIMLIKGFWYVVVSWSDKKNRQNLVEGWLDLVSGLLLVAVYLGYPFSLFAIPGVILIINGAWYLIRGLTE
jgi:uncharacterized membrane protein HdeD (DUF308 family)